MKQRGRKSSAELSVASISTIKRIPPPQHLSKEAATTWRAIMSLSSSEMIQPEAYPILVEYCRSIEQADLLAVEIGQCEPAWLKDDEGLKRFNTLLAMMERLTRAILSCAVKLRLTPSTRFHSETAARISSKASQEHKPWETRTTDDAAS